MADLHVHRLREAQHAEVGVDLVDVKDDPYVTLLDQLFQGSTPPGERDRQRGGVLDKLAGVGSVDDDEDGSCIR